MSGLWQAFLTNTGPLISKWPHYFPIYERHLAKFVDSSCTLLEIGCARGGSLHMWKRYLGPHAKIFGIDIDPACEISAPQIKTFIGDQADGKFLDKVLAVAGPIDIVIDDGSHKMGDISVSFEHLYPTVSRNGAYIVEDLHTAYWAEFEGGFRREGTFMEKAKARTDMLNAWHTRGVMPPDEFTQTTRSIHFYDSVVVFEKGDHPEPSPAISSGFAAEFRGK